MDYNQLVKNLKRKFPGWHWSIGTHRQWLCDVRVWKYRSGLIPPEVHVGHGPSLKAAYRKLLLNCPVRD